MKKKKSKVVKEAFQKLLIFFSLSLLFSRFRKCVSHISQTHKTTTKQVVEVLQMIFESPDNRYPAVEELVLCDLFRNIDLREMRGPTVSVCCISLSL